MIKTKFNSICFKPEGNRKGRKGKTRKERKDGYRHQNNSVLHSIMISLRPLRVFPLRPLRFPSDVVLNALS